MGMPNLSEYFFLFIVRVKEETLDQEGMLEFQ